MCEAHAEGIPVSSARDSKGINVPVCQDPFREQARIEKIRQARLGVKRPLSVGRKVSAALKGKKRDDAFCLATSEGLKESYRLRGLAASDDKKTMVRLTREPLRRARNAIAQGIASETRTRGLGYSEQDLKQHIESLWCDGMSWENYGDWVIDHKKSISLFPIGTDIRIINALSNLQPMWKMENWKKSWRGKYSG